MFMLNSGTRKVPATLVFAGCLSLLSLTGCTQTAPDTHEAEEKALRELDAQWSKTAGAKDLDATVAFYTDDAVVLPGDAPVGHETEAFGASMTVRLANSCSRTTRIQEEKYIAGSSRIDGCLPFVDSNHELSEGGRSGVPS